MLDHRTYIKTQTHYAFKQNRTFAFSFLRENNRSTTLWLWKLAVKGFTMLSIKRRQNAVEGFARETILLVVERALWRNNKIMRARHTASSRTTETCCVYRTEGEQGGASKSMQECPENSQCWSIDPATCKRHEQRKQAKGALQAYEYKSCSSAKGPEQAGMI